jgi:hypothetical protein
MGLHVSIDEREDDSVAGLHGHEGSCAPLGSGSIVPVLVGNNRD